MRECVGKVLEIKEEEIVYFSGETRRGEGK